jgi:uncharacterized membrane protein
MFGTEFYDFSLWWIFPLIMIALCFFMMRGRMGSAMCGHDSHRTDIPHKGGPDSAMEILDKRYALGEIDSAEYEERKKALDRKK